MIMQWREGGEGFLFLPHPSHNLRGRGREEEGIFFLAFFREGGEGKASGRQNFSRPSGRPTLAFLKKLLPKNQEKAREGFLSN